MKEKTIGMFVDNINELKQQLADLGYVESGDNEYTKEGIIYQVTSVTPSIRQERRFLLINFEEVTK